MCYAQDVPSTKPFLSFVIDPALLRRIDDYRFKHRFASRAAAVIRLIEYALGKDPKP